MNTGNTNPETRLKKAESPFDFENGKLLFRQYIQSLDFDLTFQDVDRELKEIAIEYNHPTGALILAYDIDKAIACAGIRKFDAETAELKRMFVCPEYRGQQLGKKLLQMAIEESKKIGYKAIRLDTVSNMHSAIRLYQTFGFREIDAYRFNPMEGAVYMEKEL